mmetsp:Transcript_11361/g.19050  ORF Transcript_11361/g.19050 Transcript_11361/m.19050 type:complete len:178 (+) Transcript_11361:85-618(+)
MFLRYIVVGACWSSIAQMANVLQSEIWRERLEKEGGIVGVHSHSIQSRLRYRARHEFQTHHSPSNRRTTDRLVSSASAPFVSWGQGLEQQRITRNALEIPFESVSRPSLAQRHQQSGLDGSMEGAITPNRFTGAFDGSMAYMTSAQQRNARLAWGKPLESDRALLNPILLRAKVWRH